MSAIDVPKLLSGIGLGAPTNRFIFGGAVAATLLFITKPSLSFSQDGSAKPWVVFDQQHGTPLPWWIVSLLGGALFGIFI